MAQSEQINELALALSKAQGMMTFAVKDKTNPHFRSDYADLASVLNAIREPLSKNDLAISQLPDGQNLVTLLMHKSGQWLSSITPILTTKNDAQGYGSGMTYARRYALASIAGIAQDDDDGHEASKPQAQVQAQTQEKPLTRDDRIAKLLDDARTLGFTQEYVERILGVKDFYRATDEAYVALKESIIEEKNK